MSAVSVRDARPEDREAVQAVTIAAYQQYAASMTAAHWEAYRRNIVDTLDRVAPAEQLVANEGGRIVGAALLYPAGTVFGVSGRAASTTPWPEVRLLAVAPEARGRGVGALIMDACIRRARDQGAAAITLHTTDFMQAAVRLYERLGFARARELDFDPAPGITAKGYRLDLG